MKRAPTKPNSGEPPKPDGREFLKTSSLAAVSMTAILILIQIGAGSCGSLSAPQASSSEYAGICLNAAQSPYVLPYPVGTAYVVLDGYPPVIHAPLFKFAIDFSMPSRSLVVAARAGEVQYVEQSYEDNDNTSGHENVVVIEHGDGTFARYVHLVKNGALVQIGEHVSRGQSIGLSGATGADVEHLHFDVTTGCSYRDTCQTIPVCFANTRPHPNGLQRGQIYRAEPY